MTHMESTLPLICMALTVLAALVSLLLNGQEKLRNVLLLAIGTVCFLSVLLIADLYLVHAILEYKITNIVGSIGLSFNVDGLGIVLALLASFLWVVTSLYSYGYFKALNLDNQGRFLFFFSLSIFATLGVAFAGNLLTLYLFYELLSLLTYPLVCHQQNEETRLAGRKYIAYTLGSSLLFVLPAMLLTYHYAGTLDFNSLGILAGKMPAPLAALVFFMYLFGFSKAAIMPLHGWLPAAMVAPTPVSSLLHAVAVVKVGAFSIIRIVIGIYGVQYFTELEILGFSVQTIACLIVSLTIVLASLVAMTQDNVKLRLAYSTIGQLGYIVLGALLLTPLAMTGAGLHILMHGFGKITLFFCAGAIYIAFREKVISAVLGCGSQLPVVAIALFIGTLTVVGIPPTGGFLSKWYLISGAIQADQIFFAIVYLFSSFLAVFYLLGLAIDFSFQKSGPITQLRHSLPWTCQAAIIITATGCLFLFFGSDYFIRLLSR